MKIKKVYTYTNGRTIWRLLPTETGKLVIEERDIDKKEAYFNCINIQNGKKIFKDFQFDEKFWLGIESVYNDLIFFHHFIKPDMPGHKGIFAFDILTQKIIWGNNELSYLFLHNDEIYAYVQTFESKTFFKINSMTGEIITELGEDHKKINELFAIYNSERDFSSFIFPEVHVPGNSDPRVEKIITGIKEEKLVSGRFESAIVDGVLLTNFHEVEDGGKLNNNFRAVDIDTGKTIFKERLNSNSSLYIPESFFVKDNLLFLLKDKVELKVCSINF